MGVPRQWQGHEDCQDPKRLKVSWSAREGGKNTAAQSRPGKDKWSDGSGEGGAPECTGHGSAGCQGLNPCKSRVLVSRPGIQWGRGGVEGSGPGGPSPCSE